ncbi:DUF4395 domain-containing protein [Bacillus sp. 03113]|uniref:DUF4395 domain-containing protein n=1 Tax=Bacillus sp. 03113 TaxID=2578211 RepID=UPI001144DE41|nr:DUF4395 domain-containing protein [Bacillus sp. 03113]
MSAQIKSIPRPLVRLNQSIITLSVLLTWVFDLEWILAIPIVAGLLGLLFKFNPIIQMGRLLLKKKSSEYIQEDWEQQQFNQKIAVFCLSAGLISFLFNWKVAGFIFTAMVGLTSLIAILGFCVGCFIRFQIQQYKFRRSLKN